MYLTPSQNYTSDVNHSVIKPIGSENYLKKANHQKYSGSTGISHLHAHHGPNSHAIHQSSSPMHTKQKVKTETNWNNGAHSQINRQRIMAIDNGKSANSSHLEHKKSTQIIIGNSVSPVRVGNINHKKMSYTEGKHVSQ